MVYKIVLFLLITKAIQSIIFRMFVITNTVVHRVKNKPTRLLDLKTK